MKSKYLSIFLALCVLSVGAAGCGSKSENNSQKIESSAKDESVQSADENLTGNVDNEVSPETDDEVIENETMNEDISGEMENETLIETNAEPPESNDDNMSAAEVEVGDTIVFGKYEQDDDTGNGSEDIEWTVLDIRDGSALLLSDKILDIANYHSERIDSESICWNNCALHDWLNSEFYANAFSDEEKSRIRPMHIMNGDVATDDSVFLLSRIEMEKYLKNKEDKEAVPTRYAYNQGLEISAWQTGEYWLRTFADYDEEYVWKRIDTVNVDGKISNREMHESANGLKRFGVRPAIWINRINADATAPISCPFEELEHYVEPSEYVIERTSLDMGEKVYFGRYPNFFDGIVLKPEGDMYWYVVDQNDVGEYLLMSEYAYKINTSSPKRQTMSSEDVYDAAKDSLENKFYFDAFNSDEQNMIITQIDDNGEYYDLKFASSKEIELYKDVYHSYPGVILVWIKLE